MNPNIPDLNDIVSPNNTADNSTLPVYEGMSVDEFVHLCLPDGEIFFSMECFEEQERVIGDDPETKY